MRALKLILTFFFIFVTTTTNANCKDIGNMDSNHQSTLIENVEDFFEAVASKNWQAYEKYISPDLPFYAKLPGNIEINNPASFHESQKGWFNGTTGKFEFENIRIEQFNDESYNSFVDVQYTNIDADGKPFTKYILIEMQWKFINGRWFMVQDVNHVKE